MNFKKVIKNMYVIYSIIFVGISFGVCLLFTVANKSFINVSGDGFIQHFSTYTYLHTFLKDFLINIFHNGTVKMFDFSVGSGMDILTTLNYYGYGDIFSLLIVFFKNIVLGYNCITLLRMYFAGMAMLYFIHIKYYHTEKSYKIMASISYAFSGFAIQAFRTHSYFNNALILLPLVLAGIELYQNEHKKGLLRISVAISFINNFYFAYMISIMAAFYVVFKMLYVIKSKKLELKEIFIQHIKLAIVYLQGILLSAFVLVPVVYAFLNNARNITESVGYTNSLLFYPIKYYKEVIQAVVFVEKEISMWTVLSFGGFVVVAIILLFSNKNEVKYKITFILSILGLFVPAVGKIFNGFSYVTNRWCFCIPIITAIIFMKMITNIINIGNKDLKRISIIWIIYLGITYALKSTYFNWLFNVSVFIAVLVALVVIKWIREKYGFVIAKYVFEGIFYISIALTFLISCILNRTNFADNSILETSKNDTIQAIIEKNDNDFYRVEEDNNIPNEALINGNYKNTYYYSLIPKNVTEYYNLLGCSKLKLKHRLDGLDDRTTLLTLGNVKYKIANEKEMIPYGFSKIAQTEKNSVYENSNVLPLGYIFHSYMSRKEFENLNVLEKEQTLLQTAILENDTTVSQTINAVSKDKISFLENTSEVTADNNENIEMYDKEIVIGKENSKLKLKFEGKENAENLLVIHQPEWLSETTEVYVTVYVGEKQKSFFIRNAADNFYFDRENIVINLGYFQESIQEAYISFTAKGKLKFENMQICYNDMAFYQKNIEALKENVLENIKVDVNTISGNINTTQNGILQLSVPYSKGWKAYVDHQEVNVFQTDMMYMGIEVTQGEHQVEFQYETPFLKLGIMVTMFMIGICIVERIILSIKKYVI